MHPLEAYLRRIRDIRATGGGVPEQSYYGALGELLNAVGSHLSPKVHCNPQVAGTGYGQPDYGLYTDSQLQRDAAEPLPGQLPERGVIEAKPFDDDSWLTADSEQVTRYGRGYGLVLVTNFRDFLLVGRDSEGNPQKLESYRLAPDLGTFRACGIARPTSVGRCLRDMAAITTIRDGRRAHSRIACQWSSRRFRRVFLRGSVSSPLSSTDRPHQALP